jgi:protein-disulfide isomerase
MLPRPKGSGAKGESSLIRSTLRRSTLAALASVALFSLPVHSLLAQQEVPPTPQQPAGAAAGPTFPKPSADAFTADAPTKEQVNAFLQANWGFDTNRVYQVQQIAKTPVAGISNVVVLVGEKGKAQTQALQFFYLPDGKHIITAGEIIAFDEHPFVENRATLIKRADGPSKGPASKDLEIVEFADFQCPHCKEAQATIDKILTDFPTAHFVYESFPLVKIHPQAFRSAAYGACVAKLGGNPAFFTYAAAVFDGQAGLATDEGATLTLNSAVTKAGQTPEKIEECSKTPETKATVEAGIKLAEDLKINQTPELSINGRLIPVGGVPYDTIKQMITYHAQNDGAAK